jgi:hypothetical protein
LERIDHPFEFNENDIVQEELQPMIIEVEDEKKKIIQTETIQTGSVSGFNLFFLSRI